MRLDPILIPKVKETVSPLASVSCVDCTWAWILNTIVLSATLCLSPELDSIPKSVLKESCVKQQTNLTIFSVEKYYC